MNDQQILLSKGSEPAALGEYSAGAVQLPADKTGLRIVRYRLPPEVIDRHVSCAHPVLTLLCEGQVQSHLRYGLREERNAIRGGDMMFYSGGKEVDYARWQAQQATFISVELSPERLHMLDPDDDRFANRPLSGEPRFTDEALATLVCSLWRERQAGGPQGRLFSDSLCLGLATHLYRRFGQLQTERTQAGTRLSSAQLRRIDDYIAEHLDQPIGLDDLAQEAGLSRFHFTRVFSNTIGHSPYQHVIRKRMARAYELLMSSQLSLADVALSTGFSSQAHFATLCRRVLGATPRSLREQR